MGPQSRRSGDNQINRHPMQAAMAFAFGCIGIGAVLLLTFYTTSLDNKRFEILEKVLALAGGGFAAFFPGYLDVTGKVSTNFAIRGSAGFAVFVLLYFFSPAHWKPSHDAVSQQTFGNGSPAQNGNGNQATVNGEKPQ